MKELTGVCKECLGCNKLENPLFTGVKECEYATVEDKADRTNDDRRNTRCQ